MPEFKVYNMTTNNNINAQSVLMLILIEAKRDEFTTIKMFSNETSTLN